MRQILFATLLFAWSAAAVGPARAADDWNQWRGPLRTGEVAGTQWPGDLSSLEPVWRVELDKGYPGPIVSRDKVFVAETAGGKTEVVRALDRATGRELWRASWPGDGSVPFFAASSGDWIRATPAFDGDSLFVAGMNELLVSLDAETGRDRWRVDFPARYGTKVPDFGYVSSPLVDGGHLYVQAANSLIKLDKESGEPVWRSLAFDASIMNSGAFSSPVLAEIHGRRQLVVQTRETLYGVDPASGEKLWSQPVPHFRGMNILTPTVHADGIFTSAYKQRSFFYRIEQRDGRFEPVEAWTEKSQAYMSSPVVVDGHAFLHAGSGRLVCIDLATGENRWTSPPLGKYWSMAVQGDKILALASDGELHLIRADPGSFRLLDSRQVSDQPTWGHLAVSGNELFVRELEGITAFRWPASGAAAVPAP